MPAPKGWGYSTGKSGRASVPGFLKDEVAARANALIEQDLKPRYIKPPPEHPQFNYVSDIDAKWERGRFYFSTAYTCPEPDAPQPCFEARFARLTYAGNNRFNLAFMRHTGQWVEPYTDLTLDECLTSIRDDPFFAP
jgi:hypothetical protein